MKAIIASFIICCVITILCIKLVPAPYFWAGIAWSLALVLLYVKDRKKPKAAIWFNLAFVVTLLTLAEFYFWAPFKTTVQAQGNMWLPEQFVKHDILGYAPAKNVNNVSGKKYYNDQLFYDTTYSTDQNSQRSTFPRNPRATKAIVFFGCSLTFGDGLNDEQTLPYQVGLLEKEKFNTYNFGYSGYGAHQMLSALEHGLVDTVVKEQPQYAIYTAIPGHIVRSAGLQTWIVTAHDPRYDFNAKGELTYQGHFDDEIEKTGKFKRRVLAYLSNSYILRNIYKPFKFNQKGQQTDKDLQRYIQIVLRAREVFEQRYPGAEFHIVLWRLYDSMNTDREFNLLLTAFKEHQVRVHVINDILPGFYQNNPHYQLVHDSHPTAYANYLIARYIAKDILHETHT